jgi:hypothetical protein
VTRGGGKRSGGGARYRTAKEKFRVGQRVRMTLDRVLRFPRSPETGVVIGFGHQPDVVRVRRGGLKVVSAYHMDLWEKDRDS